MQSENVALLRRRFVLEGTGSLGSRLEYSVVDGNISRNRIKLSDSRVVPLKDEIRLITVLVTDIRSAGHGYLTLHDQNTAEFVLGNGSALQVDNGVRFIKINRPLIRSYRSAAHGKGTA